MLAPLGRLPIRSIGPILAGTIAQDRMGRRSYSLRDQARVDRRCTSADQDE
jgi:hypothetical protein